MLKSRPILLGGPNSRLIAIITENREEPDMLCLMRSLEQALLTATLVCYHELFGLNRPRIICLGLDKTLGTVRYLWHRWTFVRNASPLLVINICNG